MPVEQSYLYRNALEAAGVEVTLHVLPGVGHEGNKVYPDPDVQRWITRFFGEHLA